MRRFIIAALSVATLAGVGVFAAGSFAAEKAMRPPRLPVALVCPCFSHMSCRSVQITARDGVLLKAWYYTPDSPNGKIVILLHGIGGNREDEIPLGYLFLRHGFSVLEPDLRGHGESGGLATYGVLEADDVHRWVDWMGSAPGASQLYGFGASFGASVLLASLKTETRFQAVVAESPYYDFPSIAEERIVRELPDSVKWINTPFVVSGMMWAKWWRGIDFRAASVADGLRASRTPVLLIGAEAWKKARPEFESRVLGIFSAPSYR